jgi:streptogrisin C
MRTSTVRLALLGALVASVVSLPTTASAGEAGMYAAMQRDLGLSVTQARTKVANDLRLGTVDYTLSRSLGDAYAGGWIAGDRLVVAVTNQAAAAEARAAGAEARLVTHSRKQLDTAKATLDTTRAPKEVTRWYVDTPANTLVVVAKPGATAAARQWTAGLGYGLVQVQESAEAPRLLADIRGGDAYNINGSSRCSVGFSVTGGFVSAGHCGTVGASTTGGGVAQGTFRGSTFPGSGDYSWVATNSNWTPKPVVNNYAGGTVNVAGSQEAAVGAAICRSGSTTGWKCGTIQGKNESVNYPQGTVTGMTRTNACAEPGDSGGSWLSGEQAQGVTSGGSGNCSSGGTTYFQPVNEILSAYSLTLTTTGGNDPDPPGCDGVPAWSASTSYAPGTVVSYSAHKWEATYWSTGAEPGDPRSWAVWRDAGACE